MSTDLTSFRPLVAVTMGDPAGIGPGLVMRILADPAVHTACRVVVVGEPEVMRAAARIVGADCQLVEVSGTDQESTVDRIPLIKPADLVVTDHRWGILDPGFGRAAAVCIKEALDPRWGFQAVLSAPLNKEAFHDAGYDYSDELAFMAELTGSTDCCIAGLADTVWTVAVSEHVPFSSVASLVTVEGIVRRTHLLHTVLRGVSPDRQTIAVAALNPHAGEGGLLGTEESEIIGPAVDKLLAEGLDVAGPVPADAVFVRASDGEFDGVVCMYHDQANIARKLLARRGGATILLGLPIPVTTTAHGTAFDIAGTGKASADSLKTALLTAVSLVSVV